MTYFAEVDPVEAWLIVSKACEWLQILHVSRWARAGQAIL
jgi:hypothetical protein